MRAASSVALLESGCKFDEKADVRYTVSYLILGVGEGEVVNVFLRLIAVANGSEKGPHGVRNRRGLRASC